MKRYSVILNVRSNAIEKIYNLKVDSDLMSTVETSALSMTGNTGATDYTITITEFKELPVSE